MIGLDIPLKEIVISATESGIYFLYAGDTVVYVGASRCVFHRIGGHYCEDTKNFDRVFWLPCSPKNLFLLEQAFISYFEPKYNKKQLPRYLAQDAKELILLWISQGDDEQLCSPWSRAVMPGLNPWASTKSA